MKCDYYAVVCIHGYFLGRDDFISATSCFRCHEKKPLGSAEVAPQELHYYILWKW